MVCTKDGKRSTRGAASKLGASREDVFQEFDKHLLIVYEAAAALVDRKTCLEARVNRCIPSRLARLRSLVGTNAGHRASLQRISDLQFFVVTCALLIVLSLGSLGGWSLYRYLGQSDELSGTAAVTALVERIIAVESNGDPNAKNSRGRTDSSG